MRVLEVKRSRLAQAHQMTSFREHRHLILLEALQAAEEKQNFLYRYPYHFEGL